MENLELLKAVNKEIEILEEEIEKLRKENDTLKALLNKKD